jgi:hypothetical protein
MKETTMQRFLPNENNRRMFRGFVCGAVAMTCVALGFAASALQLHALGIAAFIITTAGVVGSFIFIAFGWLMIRSVMRHLVATLWMQSERVPDEACGTRNYGSWSANFSLSGDITHILSPLNLRRQTVPVQISRTTNPIAASELFVTHLPFMASA